MTSRIGKPDTDADRELRNCLNQYHPSRFIMVAGAGSGKTTSLIKALAHLATTKGTELRRRGQQIACITYTEVAVAEILGDVGNASLFHVSTIHSFLWSVVSPYHNDLRDWVANRIDEKIAEVETKLANPRTRSRDRWIRDKQRYQQHRNSIGSVKRFIYGTGSDYTKGILGHEDVLKVGVTLITDRPLLRTLIARRFPYIFVDESQDTYPEVVNALKNIAELGTSDFTLGFFGDPMQKIYLSGVGKIEPGEGWTSITKPENFRCPTKVLKVINRIREEGDHLEQIGGRTIENDNLVEPVEGSARLFIVQADEHRNERLTEVKRLLSEMNNDPLWEREDKDADVRILVLVHRMAANRLGFSDLYAALNDHRAPNLKDGLIDGSAWVIRPFLNYLLPLVFSARSGDEFNVMAILRKQCPLLSKEHLVGQNVAGVLQRLQNDVNHLVELFDEHSNHSIGEVLLFVHNQELAFLDERFISYLETPVYNTEEEASHEEESVRLFLACPSAQLWGYRKYIEDQSLFATQQGIKGAEFQRVMVVLDDEESEYSLFSYSKYFGIEALSQTDQENIQNGTDSVIDRTRRLFYVCCSRALQSLVVVFFVHDIDRVAETIINKGLFDRENVHILT